MSKIDNVKDIVNDSIYDLIVNTDHKWVKDWASDLYKQQNDKETSYKNKNQFVLFNSAVHNEYSDPRWLTFNQIQKNKYQLEKGTKGDLIHFFTDTKQVLKRDKNGKPILDNEGKKQYNNVKTDYPVLKTYYVFNASKIKGIEPFKVKEESPEFKTEKYKKIDDFVESYCKDNNIKFTQISSESAFYSPTNKTLVMPLKEQFNSVDGYYSTLFHELTHSTSSIIKRSNDKKDSNLGNRFGSKNYAKEEMVAELGALLLCKEYSLTGVSEEKKYNTQQQSLGYLKEWLKTGVLEKEDIFIALNDATKASNLIKSYEKSNEKNKEKNNELETKNGDHTFTAMFTL